MNTFGDKLKLTIFGQSHSAAIGAVLDGLPAGEAVDLEAVREFMHRRSPGHSVWATARKEDDEPEILGGLVDGVTCGAPLAFRIGNRDAHSQDYAGLRDKPRPGHADFAAFAKSGAAHDIRGGGQFSGRLTAPLCFAGAVAQQILARRGIKTAAHVYAIAGIPDLPFSGMDDDFPALARAAGKDFPVIDDSAGQKMQTAIMEAQGDGDSVGGIVEAAAAGLPAGLGEPMFAGVENRLAQILFGIPAVRGVEFGAGEFSGFAAAQARGSQHNDEFYCEGGGVRTRTNRHGGALGGITTGMPLVVRAAFKPTPSISRPQQTVSLSARTSTELCIKGRHDPCIVPRAVPCVEAALAWAALELVLS